MFLFIHTTIGHDPNKNLFHPTSNHTLAAEHIQLLPHFCTVHYICIWNLVYIWRGSICLAEVLSNKSSFIERTWHKLFKHEVQYMCLSVASNVNFQGSLTWQSPGHGTSHRFLATMSNSVSFIGSKISFTLWLPGSPENGSKLHIFTLLYVSKWILWMNT